MKERLPNPVLAETGLVSPPRPGTPQAAQGVLQRTHAPRQLPLPLRPRR
jgi:hypothetical protein